MQTRFAILIVTAIVLAACAAAATGGDPTATIREAVKRLEAKQFDQLAELACADKKDEFAEAVDFSGQMAASLPGVDAQQVSDALIVKIANLDVKEVSRRGNAAVVYVTGQFLLRFDQNKFKEILREALKAQGLGEVDDAMLDQVLGSAFDQVLGSVPGVTGQTTELNFDVDMANEGGQWLICDDLGS